MQARRSALFCSALSLALGLVVCAVPRARAQWNAPNPVVVYEQQPNALNVRLHGGLLRIEVDAPDVLHVTYTLAGSSRPPRPSDHVLVKTAWPAAAFNVTDDAKTITLTTDKLKLVVDRDSGAVHYFSAAGQPLTTDSSRSLHPDEVNGEQTFHAEVDFAIYGSHEGFYGLGQHQAGVWNYRGEDGRPLAGKHQDRHPAAGLHQRLRHLLEQPLAQPLQQPLRPLALHQLRSGRPHRLLLPLRPRRRPDRRPLSRTDRRGAAVRPLGLRLLAVQEQVPVAGGALERSPPNTATCTSRWTTSCRTGSGGPTWAR